MIQVSNYAVLSEGLKIYTDAMRQLVREKLIAQFPNNWWDQGVLGYVTRGQRDRLKREAENNPGKNKMDLIEPGHLSHIILKEFDRAFRDVFSDHEQTKSRLQRAALARNQHAHHRSGDVPEDEAADHLYAMAQILQDAGLPEADQVEALRQQVLGIKPEVQEAVNQVASAPAGALPYWWQACEPHDSFKNPSQIDVSLFAATLGGVHAGAAREEYKNPEIFFAHTYFTQNLAQAIREVASRLNGGPGAAVTELQTPFGGGKTHALLAMYHLFGDPKLSLGVPGVREALGDLKLPKDTTVVAFDGYEFGTDPVTKENTATVYTLWGELAWQADPVLFDKLIAPSDANGEAPGNAVYRQILQEASPCLILIDELVSYLVKLKFSRGRATQRLYRQTVQFVQELLQEAGNVPGVCVLISLPQSQTEFGGLDPDDLQAELGILPELQARADRVVAKRTPVNDDEIYTLMSKRLFKQADPEVADRVARSYREVYQENPDLYGPGVLSDDYLRQQTAAYPLHPELIDVLYKKWSTATDFPRTRTVLQLMASIVADQWVDRRQIYAIQSAHVNLEREQIRTKIISAPGGGGAYDGVIATDIIGSDAHSDLLDERRSDPMYQQQHITRGLATAILMHSFGGRSGRKNGAMPFELYMSTVAPNVGPEYVREVLETLDENLWYIHREGELRRFETRPNIYRVITQNASEQRTETVLSRVREALGGSVGRAEGFRVLSWAGEDGSIADSPNPTIAVLSPDYAVTGEREDAVERREKIDTLWSRSGGGLRQWRNALILVAPDREQWSRSEEAMRELMAYEYVIDQAEGGKLDVVGRELQDLRGRLKDKQETLRISLTATYRWVFAPSDTELEVIALPEQATRDERIAGRVVKRLSDQNYAQPKILHKMGAFYFDSRLAPRIWEDEETALELGELRRRFLQWTYLPILPTPDQTLQDCIREGISQGYWAVAVGNNETMKYRLLCDRPEQLNEIVDLFDGSASLVRGELLEIIRGELAQPPTEVPGGEGPTGGETGGKDKPKGGDGGGKEVVDPIIIPTPSRYGRVRITLDNMEIAKTSNLQPYVFKFLQQGDPGAKVTITIDVSSPAGVNEETLNRQIVESLDMLNIPVTWTADKS